MTIVSIAFAFVAGALSILSPCVLPIVPIVLGAAASRDRSGLLALAAGVALAFVGIGLFVALIGRAIGLDENVFRAVAALLMLATGVVLLIPRLQELFAAASGPVANWANARFGPRDPRGLSAFGMGLLLGAVWSPCVGPTLGAASLLAAQGRELPQVALIMFAFGIGASLPLLALGALSREALVRSRVRLLSAGNRLKIALGISLAVIALLVLTGFDRSIESSLVNASPDWLTNLTTRF